MRRRRRPEPSTEDLTNRHAHLVVNSGETVTCAFTHGRTDYLGTLTVTVDAVPDDAWRYTFPSTTDDAATIGSFTLDDDGVEPDGSDPAELPSSATFDRAYGSYSVRQSSPPAGRDTIVTCSDGTSTWSGDSATRTADVELSPDADVECTFTNLDPNLLGSITIIEDSVDDDVHVFDYTTTSNQATTLGDFSLSDDPSSIDEVPASLAFDSLVPGTYTITQTEAHPDGWDVIVTCSDGGQWLPGEDDPITATVVLPDGGDVTCWFTNSLLGSITLELDTVPDDAQDFEFSLTNAELPGYDTGFSLDDDPVNGVLESVFTYESILSGTYTLTQLTEPPAGMGLAITCGGGLADSWIIDAATRSVDVDLLPGGDVTCRFSNAQLGSITIIEDSVDDDVHVFDYTTTSNQATTLGDFSLSDDPSSIDEVPASLAFDSLVPGTYTITQTEAHPDGWDVIVTCSDGGQWLPGEDDPITATVVLPDGGDVTCWFTNSLLGSITLELDTVPDDAQDFEFSLTNAELPGYDTGFSLDDDPVDGVLESVFTYESILSGTYTLTQLTEPPAGMGLAITCGGGLADSWIIDAATRSVDVDLLPGGDVTCRFSNAQLEMITVTLDADPDQALDFDFTVIGATSGLNEAFTLDDDGAEIDDPGASQYPSMRHLLGVDPGEYTVTQASVPSNYDLVVECVDLDGLSVGTAGGSGATIDIQSSASVECTFTNTQRGLITIVEDAVHTGAAVSFDYDVYDFRVDEDPVDSFSLSSHATGEPAATRSYAWPPGMYMLVPSATAPWPLTAVVCTEANSPASGGTPTEFDLRNAIVGLDPGESVTCTFTHTAPASIEVSIATDPVDSGREFTAYLEQADAIVDVRELRSVDQPWQMTLVPGVYRVGQLDEADWEMTTTECTRVGGGTEPLNAIDLAPGEDVECVLTNQRLGRIEVGATVDPADSQLVVDFQADWMGDGSEDHDFQLANGWPAFESDWLMPDTYSVTPVVAGGWDVVSECVSERGTYEPDSVTLALGETVDCDFTITPARGSVEVEVITSSGDQAFDLSTSWAPYGPHSVGGPTPVWSSDPVEDGSYEVYLAVPSGWYASDVVCLDDDSWGEPTDAWATAHVEVDPGETVKCEFTLDEVGSIVLDVDTFVDGSPADDPAVFAVDVSWGDPILVSDLGGPVDSGPLSIDATYGVDIGDQTGWVGPAIECINRTTGLITDHNEVQLERGEVVDCVIGFTAQPSTILVDVVSADPAQEFWMDPHWDYPFIMQDGDHHDFGPMEPGTYALDYHASRYELYTEVDCRNQDGVEKPDHMAIELGWGEVVTCAFTMIKSATIAITHETYPPGSGELFSFELLGTTASPPWMDPKRRLGLRPARQLGDDGTGHGQLARRRRLRGHLGRATGLDDQRHLHRRRDAG